MQLAKLREWREARGLTQKQLAAKAGVSEGTVVRGERGETTYPHTARKIADALGVSVADLLERPPVPLSEASGTGQPRARSAAEGHRDFQGTWEQFKNLTPEEQEGFLQTALQGRATFGRQVLRDLHERKITVEQAAERLHIA